MPLQEGLFLEQRQSLNLDVAVLRAGIDMAMFSRSSGVRSPRLAARTAHGCALVVGICGKGKVWGKAEAAEIHRINQQLLL